MADQKTPVASADEVKAFREEASKEWGEYVAVENINFNGARAYNAGDSVPASNVKAHGYDEQGLVARVSTKAAQEVIGQLHAASQPVVTELPPTPSLGVPVK